MSLRHSRALRFSSLVRTVDNSRAPPVLLWGHPCLLFLRAYPPLTLTPGCGARTQLSCQTVNMLRFLTVSERLSVQPDERSKDDADAYRHSNHRQRRHKQLHQHGVALTVSLA